MPDCLRSQGRVAPVAAGKIPAVLAVSTLAGLGGSMLEVWIRRAPSPWHAVALIAMWLTFPTDQAQPSGRALFVTYCANRQCQGGVLGQWRYSLENGLEVAWIDSPPRAVGDFLRTELGRQSDGARGGMSVLISEACLERLREGDLDLTGDCRWVSQSCTDQLRGSVFHPYSRVRSIGELLYLRSELARVARRRATERWVGWAAVLLLVCVFPTLARTIRRA